MKKVDQRGKLSITMVEWRAAVRVAEERTGIHHGQEQAIALSEHHLIIEQIALEHGWTLAVNYDVSQCELTAIDVYHHLGSLHLEALMKLQLQAIAVTARAPEPLAQQSVAQQHSPRKRAFQEAEPSMPRKCIASAHCFQCSGGGHFPGDCTASSTTSGRTPAAFAKGANSKHAMVAPSGKQFCFSFARGRCNAGNTCSNHHGCSICGDTGHGAGRRKSVV